MSPMTSPLLQRQPFLVGIALLAQGLAGVAGPGAVEAQEPDARSLLEDPSRVMVSTRTTWRILVPPDPRLGHDAVYPLAAEMERILVVIGADTAFCSSGSYATRLSSRWVDPLLYLAPER